MLKFRQVFEVMKHVICWKQYYAYEAVTTSLHRLFVEEVQVACVTCVLLRSVSGQSNSQFCVAGAFNATEEIAAAANYPNIRVMTVSQPVAACMDVL